MNGMQLRRETDYALRILICIGVREIFEEDAEKGVSLRDICTETGLPRVKALRICRVLEESGMISCDDAEDGEKMFYPGERMLERSMKDVIEAVESSTDVFAVFEQHSKMYRYQAGRLEGIQDEIKRILDGTSIKELIGTPRRSRFH